MRARMEAYLESLPRGLDSHPQCTAKASIYKSFFEQTPVRGLVDFVPSELEELVCNPLPSSSWVSEVHTMALYLAAADLHFATDQAFINHWLMINRSIIDSSLYRVIFAVASPERVLRGAQQRWNKLHGGTMLRLTRHGPGEVTLTLRFPDSLIPVVIARSYTTAFRATLEAAGGKDVEVKLQDHDTDLARYSATWG